MATFFCDSDLTAGKIVVLHTRRRLGQQVFDKVTIPRSGMPVSS